ncbi:MAG: hypothetical protein OSJ62_06890 [Lachnospiraceae bacterium]|nr:hypothetical protein [Lachnospiraceae bacterium]
MKKMEKRKVPISWFLTEEFYTFDGEESVKKNYDKGRCAENRFR